MFDFLESRTVHMSYVSPQGVNIHTPCVRGVLGKTPSRISDESTRTMYAGASYQSPLARLSRSAELSTSSCVLASLWLAIKRLLSNNLTGVLDLSFKIDGFPAHHQRPLGSS
jgi:hypothetical protein